MRAFSSSAATPRRLISFGAAVVLQVAIIYALASGLASQMIDKLPDDIKADIVKEKPPEQPKTRRRRRRRKMVKPPPAYSPPPDIVVSTEAPTNTITQVVNQAPPPVVAQKPAAVAATLAAGRGNNCSASYYPALAMRLNHEGATTVTVHIAADGSVTGADVGTSSGFPELDEAATRCVQAKWHFSPATENGQPVASTKQYRILPEAGRRADSNT